MKRLLQRELTATLRTRGSVINPLGFLLLSLLLFALAAPSGQGEQNNYLRVLIWCGYVDTIIRNEEQRKNGYEMGTEG